MNTKQKLQGAAAVFLIAGTASASTLAFADSTDNQCEVRYHLDSAYLPGDGYDHRAVVTNDCDVTVQCALIEVPADAKGDAVQVTLVPDAELTVLVSEENERSDFKAEVACVPAL